MRCGWRWLCGCWLAGMWAGAGWATTPLTLYSYHQAPPFVINADTETGLNFDLLSALQRELGEAFQLQLELLNRPALNEKLKAGQPAVVLWANPAFFSNPAQPYLWSAALFTDREVLVSRSNFSGKIDELTDLANQKVGTIKGYSYQGLNALVEQGVVTRADADSDKQNLALLTERQLDHVVITRSSFLYYARQSYYLGKLKITGQPYPPYRRQLLFTHQYQAVLPAFEQALSRLPQQQFWLERLAFYGLKPE